MTLGFLRGQLTFMREHGLETRVITSPGAELDAFAASEGVSVTPVPMARKITPGADLIALYRIYRAIRAAKPLIVHASTPKGGLIGSIAGRIARVPLVIYHVRGLPFTAATGVSRRILSATERIACAFAHQVLCVSNSVRDELVENGIVTREKTEVLGAGSSNGVAAETRFDPARFGADDRAALRSSLGIPKSARVIGFVGRLVRDKGIVELESAFQRILADHPDAWLLLVGPWETRDSVPEDLKQRLNSHPRTTITGSQSDVAPFYSIMDVLALPSYREGFPNVPLEAAAMELPVVAARATGSVDAIVDGETGLLVEARNADSLAAGLDRYLSGQVSTSAHGKAGRARALRDYQPRKLWTELLNYYLNALSARGYDPDLVTPK